MTKPAIALVRVSTSEQGKSGLGLAAQQEAIQQFAAAEGFDVVEVITEVASWVLMTVLVCALLSPRRRS